MSWAELSSQLDTFSLGDSAGANLTTADDFFQLAILTTEHCDKHGIRPSQAQLRSLLRGLASAGEYLAGLNSHWKQLLSAPTSSETSMDTAQSWVQLTAELRFANGCVTVAKGLAVPPSDLLAFNGGLRQLVLGSGRLALQRALIRPPENEFATDFLVSVQTLPMHYLMQQRPETNADAAEPVPPAVVMDWLEAATVLVLRRNMQPGDLFNSNTVVELMEVAYLLVTERLDAHCMALEARPNLQRALLQLLLPFLQATAEALQLPPDRRPSSWSWVLAGKLAAVVTGDPLKPALARHVASAGGAARQALLHNLQQLVLHAPLGPMEQPATMKPSVYISLLCFFLQAVVRVCSSMCSCPTEADVEVQRLIASCLLPTVDRLGPTVQAAIASAEADGHMSLSLLVGLCTRWLQLTCLLGPMSTPEDSTHVAPVISSLQDVADWCTAAAAALRALPILDAAQMLVATHLEVPPHAGVPDPAVALGRNFQQMFEYVVLGSSIAFDSTSQNVASGALEAARTAVWQLHTTCCRQLHWLLGGGGQQLPFLEHAVQLLPSLLNTLKLARCLRLMQADGSHQAAATPNSSAQPCPDRQLQGLCAAHWEALQALIARFGSDSLLQMTRLFPPAVAPMLGIVCEFGPAQVALSPTLHSLLKQAIQNHSQEVVMLRSTYIQLLRCSETSARAAATVFSLGGLQGVLPLLSASSLMHAELTRFSDQAFRAVAVLIESADAVCGSVRRSRAMADGSSSSDNDGIAGQQQQQLVGACRQKLAEVKAASALIPPSGQQLHQKFISLQDSILPAATGLACALLELWRWEQQQAPTGSTAHLELAQAAATRSCAYLRCSNLGLEGGPSAGQGVGSRKCSACRAAWYCGTSCSHADWRAGGHKRVCKELAAVRQQQRQERA